jgi:uncharacterized integral membrane protein (TIGR00698 family)
LGNVRLATASPPSPRLSTWEKLLLGVPVGRAPALLPGIGLALLVTAVAERLSVAIGWLLLTLQGIVPTGRPSPISAMTCSVLIGLTLSNSMGLHAMFRPGVDCSVKKLLRLGIILVGIRLSLMDVMRLGVWGIPVVLTVIASALLLTRWITRWLRLSPRLGALAAASTAICGVTAAMAVAPLIDADDQELAYTVANVTIFGMLAMLTYPYLAHYLFGAQSGSIGLFLGTAIHDTSQVMGAALAHKDVYGDELALKIATVTKLTRNVFLAAVVPILSLQFARRVRPGRTRVRVANLFPLFVLGFLAMAVLRSAGDAGITGANQLAFGVWAPAAWATITRSLGDTVATAALGAAMAGVGLSTNLRSLRRLGMRPLYLGAAAATIVSGVGLLLATVIGPRIHPGRTTAPVTSAPPVAAPAVPAAPAPSLPAPAVPAVEQPAAGEAVPAPFIDTDRDGIADAEDACVTVRGPARADPAKAGCPTVRIDRNRIVTIDPILFRRHQVRVRPTAKPLLFALARVLRTHAEIRRVSVNVYASEWRSPRRNAELGRRRAAAVARWLTAHQVARHRVWFRGFAAERTVAPQARRGQRLEIRILARSRA